MNRVLFVAIAIALFTSGVFAGTCLDFNRPAYSPGDVFVITEEGHLAPVPQFDDVVRAQDRSALMELMKETNAAIDRGDLKPMTTDAIVLTPPMGCMCVDGCCQYSLCYVMDEWGRLSIHTCPDPIDGE